MKYLFIFLLSTTALADIVQIVPYKQKDPKFHYRDCVKVVKGFYSSCSGVIDTYYCYEKYCTYDILITCRGNQFSMTEREDNLVIKSFGCKDYKE